MSDIYVLGIESSCDETAAAVVKNGREVLSNIISSQIDIHTLYGGVVPEIASRKHIERINQVVKEALKEAGMEGRKPDVIGVTNGPGLVGPLLIGLSFAKAYAYGLNVPFIGINHIEGHICANYIEDKTLTPPFMCLVVSGGHTHLLRVVDYGKYEILGRTLDDAAGEAFDKIARVMGLGYPGGPKIDMAARDGDSEAVSFPRGHGSGEYDFSFSGLKSAALNYLNSCEMKGESVSVADTAASFEKAVVDVLVENAVKALDQYGDKSFAIAGGVASNSMLRSEMEKACEKRAVRFYRPSPVLCTDNGAMIASAAYFRFMAGERSDLSLNAVADLKI